MYNNLYHAINATRKRKRDFERKWLKNLRDWTDINVTLNHLIKQKEAIQMSELQPGEEYISVALDAKEMLWKAMQALQKGQDKIYCAAFRHKDRKSEKEPIFRSDAVALFKRQKKDSESKVKEEAI